MSVLVDSVAGFARDGVHLRSGLYLRADMVVMAAGCKYLSQPPFLQTLGLGATLYMQLIIALRVPRTPTYLTCQHFP